MATITIDGNEYDLDSLSDEVKAQLASLQFVQTELQRLNAQIAVYKTAEAGYIQSLRKQLESHIPYAPVQPAS